MYVCLCYGVSDKKIKSMLQSGIVSNVQEIKSKCNAGGNCGMCLSQIKELVDDCKVQNNEYKKTGND